MSANAEPAADPMEEASALIRRGCDIIAGITVIDGEGPDAMRLRPAVTLLTEAATIINSVPDAGESSALRWRLYQTIQAQEGGDNAAFYKELRCSIHLGLAGECSDPVTLPCGHSYCKTCIAPLYYHGVSTNQRKCPQCRENISVPYSSLNTNVAIKGVTMHLLPLGTRYDEASIAAIEARVASAVAPSYSGGGSTAATIAALAASYPQSYLASYAYYDH